MHPLLVPLPSPRINCGAAAVTFASCHLVSQVQQMSDEQEAAQRLADEADGSAERASNGTGSVRLSATLVKAVGEAASKRGVAAPFESVCWALRRSAGHEGAAIALLAAQPTARVVLAALRDPGAALLVGSDELATVSAARVRRARTALRRDGVRQIVEAYANTGHEACHEATASLPEASRVEILLLQWASAVCDYVEADARTQPARQKVMRHPPSGCVCVPQPRNPHPGR